MAKGGPSKWPPTLVLGGEIFVGCWGGGLAEVPSETLICVWSEQ